MTVELFITILGISISAVPIGIQTIKNMLDKLGLTYKSVPLAIGVSMAVGIIEIFIYYFTNGLEITIMTVLFAVCMGFANALASTNSYDLVCKLLLALFGKSQQGGN